MSNMFNFVNAAFGIAFCIAVIASFVIFVVGGSSVIFGYLDGKIFSLIFACAALACSITSLGMSICADISRRKLDLLTQSRNQQND